MPFSGAGVFIRVHNWVQDKIDGLRISATRVDEEFDNFRDGLSLTITRDGQTTIEADIPLNGNRLTEVGDAQEDTDALNRRTGNTLFLTKAAGGTSAGDLQIAKSTPTLRLTSTLNGDFTVRVPNNGRLQVTDGGATVEVLSIGLAGDISTRQFGDLNTRIETRAAAYAENARVSATGVANAAQASANAAQGTANGAASAAAGAQGSANSAYSYADAAYANGNNRVSKFGDSMSGALEIISPGVQHVLHFPGVKRAYWYIGGDGILRYQDQGGTVHFQVGGSGEIYTQQMGDLATRIENRAAAFADAAYNNANGYSNASFVRAIRQTSYAELYMNGGWTFAYDGWVMTGIYRSNDGFAQYMAIRAMQYLVNGGWYTGNIS